MDLPRRDGISALFEEGAKMNRADVCPVKATAPSLQQKFLIDPNYDQGRV